MSQYDNLKATIAANVYENHNNQVTANMVKAAMNAMTDSLGAGYQYLGIATPNTAPGTPDQKVFYIAAQPGTYTDFGLVVNDGEVAILKWDTAWHKEVTGAATAAQVTELSQDMNGIAKSSNQFAEFTGNAWTDFSYNLYAGYQYRLTYHGPSNGSMIAMDAAGANISGFTTLYDGDSCTITVDADATSGRFYLDNGGSVEIVNIDADAFELAKNIPSLPAIDDIPTYNSNNLVKSGGVASAIDEVAENVNQKKVLAGSGWTNYAYNFYRGYTYKVKNLSQVDTLLAMSAVNSSGVEVTINGYRNLAPGEEMTITVSDDAVQGRFYLDSGALSFENVSLNLSEEFLGANKDGGVPDGYSSKDTTRHIVTVAKDGSGHYTNLADAYAAIVDSAFDNQYEVVVYPGKYPELNLIPPAFTHTHGLAPNSVVISSEGVDPSSSLPVFDQQNHSSKLSNMTIESHNGYCIHFDISLHDKSLVNENLHLIKADTVGGQWAIIGGGSFMYGTKYIWKNCIFESKGLRGGASCHTNANAVNENTHLTFDSCQFINCSPSVGSVGGFGHCVCELVNCRFPIGEAGLTNWISPLRNLENPKLYLFNTNEWQIIGGGNANLSMLQQADGKTIRMRADHPISISGDAAPIIFGENPCYNNTKTPRIDCYVISEYYIDDSQAGLEPYSTPKDVYQLWKRLGNCSVNNKVLTVEVDGVTRTHIFTEDFETSQKAQAAILAEMQSSLDNVVIEALVASGYSYDNVVMSDAEYILVAADDIMKGEFVTINGGVATSATDKKDIIGIACEDKPGGEYIKVWTSAFRFDDNHADGEYGLDANGDLDASAATKIGFIKNNIFYLR